MASRELDIEAMNKALSSAQISEENKDDGDGVQITCFSEVVNDVTLHFQIMRLAKQVHPLPLLSYVSLCRFWQSMWIDSRYMHGLVATLQNLDTCMQRHLHDLYVWWIFLFYKKTIFFSRKVQ